MKISMTRVVGITLGAALLGVVCVGTVGCGKKQQQAPAGGGTDALSQPGGLFSSGNAPTMGSPEDVLIVVDGNEIKQKDVDAELTKMLGPNAAQMPPERMAQIRAQMSDRIKDSLVVRSLLEKEIDSKNIEIGDEEIEEALGKLDENLPPGATREEFMARMGMTEEALKEALTMDLRINKLLTEELGEVPEPAEEEVEAFYSENEERFKQPELVEARHILIAVEPTDDDATKAEKKKKAEELRQKIVDGAAFEDVAAEESSCPSKARGGNLGRFARGQMVPAFEEAAFTQEIGEIGPVVETDFGYHIIEVLEHSDEGTVSLDEAKEDIIQNLTAQEKQEAVEKYVEGLKAKADIQYPEK